MKRYNQREFGMKEIIGGLLALCFIVLLGVTILAALFLLSYATGWTIGWIMQLVLGFDMIFGVTFPQFIGLSSVFSTLLTVSLSTLTGTLTDKVGETMTKKFKEYRGY